MTKQVEIINDPKYRPLLDYGFVGIVDYMGNDDAIVQAARVSYGAGTKVVRPNRGLIRYLIRKLHCSPIEMCTIKMHIKIPIFVMRQLVRHRTASLNEISFRYSEMVDDEFYVPEPDQIMPQSASNKQGRAGSMDDTNKSGVRWMIKAAVDHAFAAYRALLGKREYNEFGGEETLYDPYHDSEVFNEDFPGIARELARVVLPVNAYTELYFQMNLRNLFHLIHLRKDPHAQYEIRVLAEAIFDLIKPLFPLACEAAEDYIFEARNQSRMEKNLIKDMIHKGGADFVIGGVASAGSAKDFAASYGMIESEFTEFLAEFNILLPTT